jgi:type II secretory pathway predicted ATPase ExeA
MYENFYGFREKPFSLLPDAGFLYLSAKHRMALTLLEYGLMNQAGFTVISGDIGTGKTTLIRQVLNNIDSLITVGLISNTHRTFGDLMQWIALAFGLPHQGKDKVQLYHEFMQFIIAEYAQGRRTVLIVDEAQNMSAETLEELRMLSNVNADKDQVLQIILVGQRELRDTLRRPELVQFAQRVGVDYHLDPLTEQETSDYIRHRCKVAGGKPELFSAQARQAVFEHTGGVPRLVNLLCDTALVYGYAEQRDHIDAKLVNDVAADKQAGGLFPRRGNAAGHQPPAAAAPAAAPAATMVIPSIGDAMGRSDSQPAPISAVKPVAVTPARPAIEHQPKKPMRGSNSDVLRVAIAAESELLRIYLSKMLSRFGIRVVAALPLNTADLHTLDQKNVDVLLVELGDHLDNLDDAAYELFEKWQKPVLFNDSLATEASLSQPNRLEYGRKLSEKLYSLAPQAPQSVA